MVRSRTVPLMILLVLVSASPAHARWQPKPEVTWQWQLQGEVDTSIRARVYDIDGFDNGKALVDVLHDRDRKAICYISGGSWEDWRPDADDFPDRILGKNLEGWPGERWLDIRERDVLRPIMRARVQMCDRKGFDGIEFDNVDGYANDSGFDLKGSDQIAYNRLLARLAHDHGLAAGLKNDLGQVATLEPNFDFAINEQCFRYDECNRLKPFIDADKAVLHVEYELARSEFCPEARGLSFSSLKKRYSLTAWRRAC